MDNIFKYFSDYCLVYIDDILVFLDSLENHKTHLKTIFTVLIENGIAISTKKIKLCKPAIEYLGLYIKGEKIQLQEHIVKKIFDFPDKLNETKKLQAFLGILNYARNFIPNLSKLVGPLYSKTSSKGTKFFNQEDIKQIQKIKQVVKNLQPLSLPFETDYKIVETGASK